MLCKFCKKRIPSRYKQAHEKFHLNEPKKQQKRSLKTENNLRLSRVRRRQKLNRRLKKTA